MPSKIAQVLMERDNMPEDEAEEMVRDAKERVRNGEDPEEILYDEFGLELDYLEDLL